MFWKIAQSQIQVKSHIKSIIPYSSVIIDVDSCCIVITQLSWSDCHKNLTINLVAITQLKQWPVIRKKCETKLH